jgi:hypothetical protein
MIMKKYISQYQNDKIGFQAFLDQNPILAKGAAEMCAQFNLYMGGWRLHTSKGVVFITPEGFEAGTLEYAYRYAGPNKGKHSFQYIGPFVSKEKGTGVARRTREASKITGIISAMTKNGEVPNTNRILEKEKRSLSYAFGALKADHAPHYGIEMSQRMMAGLLVAVFEKNYESIEADKDKYLLEYNKYVAKAASIADSRKASKRFYEGSTAIGIAQDNLNQGVCYFVCTATKLNDTIVMSDVTRYNSLRDSPLASEAAIIRTYMQGKTESPFLDNELNMRLADEYHADIDVACGYSSSTESFWVLIPNQAE